MESSICRSEKRRTDCFDERQSVRFYFMRIGETKSKAEQSGKHRGLNWGRNWLTMWDKEGTIYFEVANCDLKIKKGGKNYVRENKKIFKRSYWILCEFKFGKLLSQLIWSVQMKKGNDVR